MFKTRDLRTLKSFLLRTDVVMDYANVLQLSKVVGLIPIKDMLVVTQA